MKIPVIFSHGVLGNVSAEELEGLLRVNALVAFRRSNGWVAVDFDDMRDPGGRRGSSWKDRKTLGR